jgi:serine/threonine-protein kinase RsbW
MSNLCEIGCLRCTDFIFKPGHLGYSRDCVHYSTRHRTFVKEVREQFDMTADPANAGMARSRLRAAAGEAGLAGVPLDDLEVALGEAVSNAILHGSPTPESVITICIAYTPRTSEFAIEVTDQGPGFDPASVRRLPTNGDVNGRGLKMMASLVDKAVLFRGGSGMTVRLTKRLHLREM